VAVYKRTYKVYDGALTPSWSRFLVLSRYSASSLFDSRYFTAFTLLCLAPVLIGALTIYFIHSPTAQLLLGMQFNSNDLVNNLWFWGFLQGQVWLAFLMTLWAVPGMMTRDFANHALQLYLSRPLSRTEYLLGKISAVVLLLSGITWVPGLLLFGLQAQLEGHGWGRQNLWLMGSIFIGCLLWISVIALLAMALSVWVKWRIAASALMLAIFFVLPGFGEAANAILRTQWGKLLSVPYVMVLIWTHLFRLPAHYIHGFHYAGVPVWSAWMSVLGVCFISLLLLNRRLKAREVERR
jgi:ABC-2 type transport system permease protein